MLFVIILVPVVLFGLVGGISYYFLKKAGYANENAGGKNESTAQDFIPIEKVEDGCLVLNGGKYRKYIECSSTNYALKTDEEQISIEMIFQRFINSLTFPVVIFLQTKVIDNSKRLRKIQEDGSAVKRTFPALENYADQYLGAMRNINDFIGNSTQKKKYIILPYDDVVSIDGMTEADTKEYIKRELENRCDIVMSGLAAIDVKTKVLNDEEIIELIYSSLYRDDYTYAENINEHEALALLVSSKNNSLYMPDAGKKIASNLLAAANLLNAVADENQEARADADLLYDLYRKFEAKPERV